MCAVARNCSKEEAHESRIDLRTRGFRAAADLPGVRTAETREVLKVRFGSRLCPLVQDAHLLEMHEIKIEALRNVRL